MDDRVVQSMPVYFTSHGITPHASPETILFTMQRADGFRLTGEARTNWLRENLSQVIDRTTATGLLFGYPKSAVDAYAQGFARVIRGDAPPDRPGQAAPLAATIPTFAGETNGYRKAAAEDTDDDRAFRQRALEILTEYRARRDKYIGGGKPGIVSLLRDWFCAASACKTPL